MIDPAAHLVTFDGGTHRATTSCCSRPARRRAGSTSPAPALTNVLYLRTLPESDALRAAFTPGARVVIVGAGWIGLEAAAAARDRGLLR